MTIEFAKFLIFLEICYTIYWFTIATFIVYSYDTATSEIYRVGILFLGIHLLITPTAIFYVINSSDRPVLILWIFVISFFYDMVGLFDVTHHLDHLIIPLAWKLEYVACIWIFVMSTLALFWYIIQIWKKERKSIYAALQNK